MLKSIKRITIISICILIIIAPLMCNYNNYSYADDSWHDITDLSGDDYKKYIVGGIKAGLNYFGYKETFSYDIAKAIWTYNYSQWDKIAKAGGYSGVEELNTKIKYRIDSDYKLHFKVTMSGLQFINDLLHEIVDYYNLTQGYTKEIYSGKYFQDDNGIGCYVFIIKDQDKGFTTDRTLLDFNTNVLWGTPYRFSGKAYYETNESGVNTYTINYNNKSYTYHMKVYKGYFNNYDVAGFSTSTYMATPTGYNGYIYLGPDNPTSYQTVNGWVCITTNQNMETYYLGSFSEYYAKNSPTNVKCLLYSEIHLEDIPLQNQSINGNYTPNNNTADDDKDINTGDDNVDDFLENNNPDVTYDTPTDSPSQQPVPPDSVIPNPNNPTVNPGNPDFNFQMPDLNIDWNLPFDVNNMPFPFSIPFDIKNFLEILDAEPIAPSYEFDFYILDNHIEYEIDLSQFDDVMEIIRNIELAGYCIFLIISTRALFHIY